MDAGELGDFLESHRGEGSYDSSGKFSLSLEQGLEKLRQHRLARPGSFLLKLVQAAVAAGAQRIQIESLGSWRGVASHGLVRSRPPARGLRLAFSLPSGALTVRRTLESLGTLDRVEEPFHHLRVALPSACGEPGRRASWSVWEGGQGEVLELPDQQFRALPLRAETDCLHVFELRGEPRTPGFLRELHWRCRFAPVEIVVDGFALPRSPLPPRAPPWHQELSHPFYLAMRTEAQGELGLRLELPEPDGPQAFLVQDYRTGLLEASALYALGAGLEGPGRVSLVHHGVLLETVYVESPVPGAEAVISSQGLGLDLSGFQVLRDERWEKRLPPIREHWRSLAHALVDLVDNLEPRRNASTVRPWREGLRALGMAAVMVGGAAAAVAATPVAALPSLGGMLWLAKKLHDKLGDQAHLLRKRSDLLEDAFRQVVKQRLMAIYSPGPAQRP